MIYFFPEYTDACNFADDTSLHACEKDLNSLINRLERDNLLAIGRFENNNMKLKQDKCHLIVSGHKYENVFASAGKSIIWETENQKLLDIIINKKLNVSDFVTSMCKKARKK